jgi:sn-glycerol 3-phosphate transport system ATP-binding protein
MHVEGPHLMSDISIRALTRSYGATPVLHGIDLEIASGEFAVLLGPSGCGKSTLLRLVAGLDQPDAGAIAIAGRDVLGLEPKDRGCAMVFQNYALYPHMTVAENIGYGLRIAGIPKAERRARVEQIAELVQLRGMLDRKPGQLSGGQRQRVAMARAVIRSPELFLFDEPLSNLDAKLRTQMRHEVRRLHAEAGATSIFVTHDQVEGMTLADRLIVMNGGRIEQIGTPSDIYERPATRFVAAFVGSPPMTLLSATVCEDGRHLQIEGGERLDAGAGWQGLRPGSIIDMGVRPENLLVADDRALRSKLTGHFLYLEDLGTSRVYHLRFGTAQGAMISPSRTVPDVGTAMPLTFDDDALHLFDHKSGLRILRTTPVVSASG